MKDMRIIVLANMPYVLSKQIPFTIAITFHKLNTKSLVTTATLTIPILPMLFHRSDAVLPWDKIHR
jgi:hypothetical protein